MSKRKGGEALEIPSSQEGGHKKFEPDLQNEVFHSYIKTANLESNLALQSKDVDALASTMLLLNRAEKIATKIPELALPLAAAYNILGVACVLLGQHEKSFESYNRALQLDPQNGKFAINLMESHKLLGHALYDFRDSPEEGLGHLRESLSVINKYSQFVEPSNLSTYYLIRSHKELAKRLIKSEASRPEGISEYKAAINLMDKICLSMPEKAIMKQGLAREQYFLGRELCKTKVSHKEGIDYLAASVKTMHKAAQQDSVYIIDLGRHHIALAQELSNTEIPYSVVIEHYTKGLMLLDKAYPPMRSNISGMEQVAQMQHNIGLELCKAEGYREAGLEFLKQSIEQRAKFFNLEPENPLYISKFIASQKVLGRELCRIESSRAEGFQYFKEWASKIADKAKKMPAIYAKFYAEALSCQAEELFKIGEYIEAGSYFAIAIRLYKVINNRTSDQCKLELVAELEDLEQTLLGKDGVSDSADMMLGENFLESSKAHGPSSAQPLPAVVPTSLESELLGVDDQPAG